MKKEKESGESVTITREQIDQCIAMLAKLNSETDQIFDIPKEQRTALLMAAGRFSRQGKEELALRKKSAKKNQSKENCLQGYSSPQCNGNTQCEGSIHFYRAGNVGIEWGRSRKSRHPGNSPGMLCLQDFVQ